MLIINIGQIVDGLGNEPKKRQQIRIRGNRIVEIKDYVPEEVGSEEQVIDAKGGTVLPGLIDAHVHLDSPGAGSDALGEETTDLWQKRLYDTDAVAVLRMARNGELALLAGITTVRDCSSRHLLYLSLKEAVARDIFKGPRLLASGQALTITGGHEHVLGYECDSSDELRKATRDLMKTGSDFIKIMITGGFSTPGSGVKKSQYTEAEMAVVVQEAHRMGKHVAAHAHATAAINAAVSAGIDTIEHCSWIGPDDDYDYGTDWDMAVVEEMAAKGIAMSKAFGAVDRLKEMLWARQGKEQLERHRRDRVEHGIITRKMIDAGVKLITGTDAGGGTVPINQIALSLADWREFCGLSALDSIATATGVAAEVLGLPELGSVGCGKIADLIIVPDDPLVDLNRLANVDTVILDGRVVVRGGRLL